ncbi:MAG: 50S ribosomal protein L25 [Candidatus Kapaibacterium sp.]
MSEIILEAKRREPGRSAARAMRRQSTIPGIYYFHGEDPISISVPELSLRPLIFTTESHLVRMKLEDGTEKTCVLKDIVFDPITDRPTHFDLLGITANEKIRVEVPVSLQGQAIGMQHGGIVDFALHKLEIECIPSEIPDHITVDITNLDVNDSIHVSDLNLPRITIISPADLNIVSISPSRVSEEPTAAAAEPEVIAKGKAEDK